MASRYPLEKAKEAVRLSASSLGYPTRKTLQEEVIVQFVMGHDVFAVLSTGYGKSLCYACLPRTFLRSAERASLAFPLSFSSLAMCVR